MAKTFLKNLSQAAAEKGGYVEYGYGQVEPNHLSAQRTGQIYAQLPTADGITVLENGQFVKYDYAARDAEGKGFGEVNFKGAGEWMLVYNEVKLYREEQDECEFAMVQGNYHAHVYSPSDGVLTENAKSRNYADILAPMDPYSLDATNDPFHIYNQNAIVEMPAANRMVPRVFKTNVGDIFTTNLVAATELKVGDTLAPNANGILAVAEEGDMLWQVVKVYTMPDYQKGVKVMRIK